MNLSQLQAECGRLLNDPLNTRWSTDVLTTRINFAQTEIEGFTQAIKTTVAFTLTAGNSDLSVGSVMSIYRVLHTRSDGSIVPLLGITTEELDFRDPNWRQYNPGEPRYWILNEGSLTITLVPAPDANNVVTNGLKIAKIIKPADLVNPTDSPFDDPTGTGPMLPYHISIVHWVVAQCWMDDGTPESLAKAKFHRSGDMLKPGQYELQLARITSEFDVPDLTTSHVLFQPQGGRIGQWFIPNKTNPFDF